MANKDCAIDMTLCPECVQYIRHCLGHVTVSCPFCDTTFSPKEVEGKRPTASGVSAGLKNGVMAASFVGATMLGGMACQPVSEPEYGAPMPPEEDVGVEEDVEESGDAQIDEDADTGPDEDADDDE